MNYLPPLALFSAVAALFIGTYVLALHPGKRLNQVFFISNLAASYWAFTEFMLQQAVTLDQAMFWLKAESVWPLDPALFLHFVLLMTGNQYLNPRFRKLTLLLLYIPALIFVWLEMNTDSVIGSPVHGAFGYSVTLPQDPVLYCIEAVWALCLGFMALFLAIQMFHKANSDRVRKQTKLYICGFSIPLWVSLDFFIISFFFGIPIPDIIPISLLGYSACIGYAIWRYDFFTISPESSASRIIETISDSLILIDSDNCITTVNNSITMLLGFQKSELINQPASAIIQSKPPFSEIIQRICEEKILPEGEAVCTTKDGRSVQVSISGSLILDHARSPAGAVCIIRDITERKRSEMMINNARAKLNLLSTITRHDILNQITILQGYLVIAASDPNITDPFSQYTGKCLGVTEVIRQQIAFTKDYEVIGMHAPAWQKITDICSNLTNLLDISPVHFTQNAGDLVLYADPLLEKVFYTLFENTIRHGGSVSEIMISSEETPEGLVLIYEDNGAGVEESDKKKIFFKGFGKNTGLGLFLAQEILAITEISIRENGRPGTGARFELLVPDWGWKRVR
jgi:PAS domain S-box-containing protein